MKGWSFPVFTTVVLALFVASGWLLQIPVLYFVLAGFSLLILLMSLKAIPFIRTTIHSQKELLRVNQHLLESENRFRSAFDYASIGMALIALDGHCLKVNQALCNILGLTESEILNLDLKRFTHPDDVKKNMPVMQKMLAGEIKTYQTEERFFHKNSEVIWVLVNMSLIYSAENKPLYFIVQIQNISAEKRAEEQLRQMAYHDPLTGLANRNKLEQYLHQQILVSRRHDPGFAIIFLDLDNFKNINDTIGHDSGDVLLQVIAERLKTTVRETDMVARLGGDEFVFVITHIKHADSVAGIAQKILHNLLRPVMIKGHEVYVTTSIGISCYPYDGQDIQTLMKNADLALYRAKEQGKNNYQFCTIEMTEKSQEKMIRQSALSHALVKDEFCLFYQPIMNLNTKKIVGLEALLRWKNKDFMSVSTEEIIALSEESGLIVALSEWIIRTACKQVKLWHNAGFIPLTVAVNLSPRQFKQSNFVESIVDLLRDIDFPSQSLDFEMTEGLIMQDPENTLRILQEFKRLKIKLSIDDFGTGYSSMSYLKRFAVDQIKIDKTFIHQLPYEAMSLSIVSATIAMAHKLGIKTVAEGVETKEQYHCLVDEGCDEIQGYYLCKPLPVEKMTEFLIQSKNEVRLLENN